MSLKWFAKKGRAAGAARPFFSGAPSMGAILEVKVLPEVDHSERSEAQLHEGD
jgi:hypothetical protein